MKKLNLIDKIVYIINAFIALMLLLSYVLPYVTPQRFAILSVLSLAVPLLILLNLLFVIYWLLKLKKQIFLSLFVLVIGYKYVTALYKYSDSKNLEDENNISVMNFNVRLFNVYNWIKEKGIETKIVDFIKSENPDIVSFQEYHPHDNVDLSFYPYKYEKLAGQRIKYGQAIFSKYPIVNSGSIEFPNTANNAIYVDILKDVDTIRIYNVHLQSLRIDAKKEELTSENSERLLKRVGATFKMQQSQTELFLEHKKRSPYKMIVCGDFNNTTNSYVYNKIKGELVDAFESAGNGFGRTFDFKYFPVRIDFILVDEAFQINNFQTFDESLSDHYPILAKVNLHE
ncbi:MAG: endonuclease/exonuclease/phosphatase family protein [Flavobacteriaceae bacterium]|nr:endonuclease/exonuclease/phosphatase family protein [Flavobacteriaceae bacterium]